MKLSEIILLHRLTISTFDFAQGAPLKQEAGPEDAWDFSGETITIKSYFTPLVLSTMSKYNTPSPMVSFSVKATVHNILVTTMF